MNEYIQVSKIYSTEYIVEKSRFIGTVAPCTTVEEAQEFIAKMNKEYWDATHNCTAFCIGPKQEQQRSSDNGEPSGTAGKPMLEAMKKREITNTVLVVTRYFGGIKLGAGGLIRAYSHIAHQALEEAPKELHSPRQLVTVNISYPLFDSIDLFLQEQNIYSEKDFGADVKLTLYLPLERIEEIYTALQNMSNGTMIWKKEDIKMVALPL